MGKNYKERFEFFIDGIERERKRAVNLLEKTHRKRDYATCLEYRELIYALDWLEEYVASIFETGKE